MPAENEEKDQRVSPATATPEPKRSRSWKRIAITTALCFGLIAGIWGLSSALPSAESDTSANAAPATVSNKQGLSYALIDALPHLDKLGKTAGQAVTDYDEAKEKKKKEEAAAKAKKEKEEREAKEAAEKKEREKQAAEAAAQSGAGGAGGSVSGGGGSESVQYYESSPGETVTTPGSTTYTYETVTEYSGGEEQTVVEQPQFITVKVIVRGSGVNMNTQVDLLPGSSAFDALVATGIPVDARGSEYGVYVAAIGGLAEKDQGPSSGWMYSVNGSTPGVSAATHYLQSGDTVEWFYTT